MSYPNEVYTLFAFIGFLLVTIPFPWHLEGTDMFGLVDKSKIDQINEFSLEHWDLSLHGLDWISLPQSVYQFYHLEWECD